MENLEKDMKNQKNHDRWL